MPSVPTKVVFLIDEQCLLNPEGITFEKLQLSIVRVLLFYYYQSGQLDVLWGFRFFNTGTRYASASVRHFYPMAEDSFQVIQQEFEKRDNNEKQSIPTIDSSFSSIKQVLKEAIGDFQWENAEYSNKNTTSRHYVYVLTDCPTDYNSVKEISSQLSSFSDFFEQTKEDLATTLLQSYTERQISISLIDTTFKIHLNNLEEQNTERMITQGLMSCFNQFGGNYIQFTSLVRNHNMYGHSFISEFTNILPNPFTKQQQQQQQQIPAWKGLFKTKLGKNIGNFSLFPIHKNGNYQAMTLAFITEIRTHSVLHASQFSLSWLLEDSAAEPNHDYRFTFDFEERPQLFNAILDELHATQSILIADLIPMPGYEEMARKVCIEPLSKSNATLRFLNIKHLNNTIRLDQVIVDDDYPIGSFLNGTKIETILPKEQHAIPKLNLEAPAFIKKIIQNKLDKPKEKLIVNNIMMNKQKEDVVEKSIELPTNVNIMGSSLKKLYLQSLYTQNNTIEHILTTIDEWIEHLLKKNYTNQRIISTLFDHTMTVEDLEAKHGRNFPDSYVKTASKLEREYLAEWWSNVEIKSSANSNFKKMSRVILKLKEARLQVIIYCFIARLANNVPENTIKRDPLELAKSFFTKTILPFATHGITEFLTDLDSEEGALAISKRDPADLHDHAFTLLIEKKFTDLPSLTSCFEDDLSSITSSPSRDEDDLVDELELSQAPSPEPTTPPSPPLPPPPSTFKKEVKEPKKHLLRRALSDRPPPKHTQLDYTHLSKPHHRKSPPSSSASLSKYSKSLLPVPMQRSSSNSKLDILQKRMIHVPSSKTADTRRGEAAQEAIAKVNRSSVNGKPTMKRTGSFTKSAQSPKRIKRNASMLSTDSHSVVLRRENVPDPQTTPRTSLNRHLGTNLFTEYSEACLSPSSRITDGEVRASQDYLQSEYPQERTTPQNSSNRIRKMMTMSPNEDDHDDMEDEFSVFVRNEARYTPRTAAKKAKEKSMQVKNSIRPNRNLTSEFENLYQEEKEKPTSRLNSSEVYNPFMDHNSLARSLLDSSENRKISGFSFVEDSDSESEHENSFSL